MLGWCAEFAFWVRGICHMVVIVLHSKAVGRWRVFRYFTIARACEKRNERGARAFWFVYTGEILHVRSIARVSIFTQTLRTLNAHFPPHSCDAFVQIRNYGNSLHALTAKLRAHANERDEFARVFLHASHPLRHQFQFGCRRGRTQAILAFRIEVRFVQSTAHARNSATV